MFQSTHLHEVWPRTFHSWGSSPCFNPHTYMRCDHVCLLVMLIRISFNPHTYMRCDSVGTLLSLSCYCFNPHTYMRCDNAANCVWSKLSVSIHTPTWGVTVIVTATDSISMFQSTHLHEVWLNRSFVSKRHKGFNPHTYMRCDTATCGAGTRATVSIHTPTWGVTPPFALLSVWMSVSIHTPTWGVTNNINAPIEATKVSIHTPTWGVTP